MRPGLGFPRPGQHHDVSGLVEQALRPLLLLLGLRPKRARAVHRPLRLTPHPSSPGGGRVAGGEDGAVAAWPDLSVLGELELDPLAAPGRAAFALEAPSVAFGRSRVGSEERDEVVPRLHQLSLRDRGSHLSAPSGCRPRATLLLAGRAVNPRPRRREPGRLRGARRETTNACVQPWP